MLWAGGFLEGGDCTKTTFSDADKIILPFYASDGTIYKSSVGFYQYKIFVMNPFIQPSSSLL